MAPLFKVPALRAAALMVTLTAKERVAQLSSWKVPLTLTERTAEMSQHELGQLLLITDKDGDAVLAFRFTTHADVRLMGEYVGFMAWLCGVESIGLSTTSPGLPAVAAGWLGYVLQRWLPK